MKKAALDDGERAGGTPAKSAANLEMKRRVRLLEQENEVLVPAAAYLGQGSGVEA